MRPLRRAARWVRHADSIDGFSPFAYPPNPNWPDSRGLCSRHSLEPLAHGDVLRDVVFALYLTQQPADHPVALGDHVVLVDRLQVLLAGEDEGPFAQVAEALDGHSNHLADAVLDEARVHVGLLHDL